MKLMLFKKVICTFDMVEDELEEFLLRLLPSCNRHSRWVGSDYVLKAAEHGSALMSEDELSARPGQLEIIISQL